MAAQIKFNGHEIEVQDGCEVVVEGERLIVRPTPQPLQFIPNTFTVPNAPAWNPTWIGPSTIAPFPTSLPFTITCGEALTFCPDPQAASAR